MSTINITIPSGQDARVADAICTQFNYQPDLDGTKAQFVKKVIINYIKSQIKEYEAKNASAVAYANAAYAVESEVNLT